MKKIISFFLAAAIFLSFAGACFAADEEVLAVKCYNGIFTGKKNDGVISFKGIPYAKAPSGERRWKAPEPVDASDETFDATEFGNVCLQSASTEHVWGKPMSEDCLTLNIWASDLETKNKPVMFWIHGGSYGWGGTNDPLYDGKYLVDTYGDLIVVTVNYRVNLLGFIDFSHVPGGEEFPDAPYLGILDQQMALKWVQQNIEAFGGDPDNVTIFGESAGGGSVISLMAAEGSDGLFRRAIAMSGAGLNYTREKYDSQNQAGELLAATGCATMDDLMALSEDKLLEAMEKGIDRVGDENGSRVSDFNNFPMKDDEYSIIPADVAGAVATRASEVDLMIGTVGDEMRYWIEEMGMSTDDENMKVFYDYIIGRFASYKERFPEYTEKLETALAISRPVQDEKYSAMYPGIWEYTDISSELSFRIPSIEIAEKHAAASGSGKTYMYSFNKRGTVNDWIGACHACELCYAFNNTEFEYMVGKADPQLAADVSAAWVAFARTGDPSTSDHPWPEFNADTRTTMIINDDCSMMTEDDPRSTMRVLLEPVKIF